MTTRRHLSPVRTLATAAAVVAVSAVGACVDEYGDEQEPSDVDPYFTKAEWGTIESLSPAQLEDFGPPEDPTNAWADNIEAARLGHRLFFDCRLGEVQVQGEEEERSCATCHAPEYAFSDAGIREMDKDVTSVLNIAQYDYHTAIGKFDSLWSMPIAPTENAFLNTNRLSVTKLIANVYADAYLAVFGDQDGAAAFMDRARTGEFDGYHDWACSPDDPPSCRALQDEAEDEVKAAINRIYANYGKAMAAYMRRITTGHRGSTPTRTASSTRSTTASARACVCFSTKPTASSVTTARPSPTTSFTTSGSPPGPTPARMPSTSEAARRARRTSSGEPPSTTTTRAGASSSFRRRAPPIGARTERPACATSAEPPPTCTPQSSTTSSTSCCTTTTRHRVTAISTCGCSGHSG